MGLIAAFIIFVISMVFVLITGHSMIWALLVGLAAFSFLGYRALDISGIPAVKELTLAGWKSVKESLVVIQIMLIIGVIAASWRISGTITIFVYYGMKIIVPPLFLLITYLLACLLSYALGTSFGVAGTVGIIFMALARSGDVNPFITAGVLMSGIYFGDRCSPVSSSANLVAGVTKTEMLPNVKMMMKTGILPFIITLIIYTVLSIRNPLSHVDTEIINMFQTEFTLSLWAFVPAVLMLLLPLLKVAVLPSIGISIISSCIIALAVEKVSILVLIRTLLFGYQSTSEGLGSILNGGGLFSMLEIAVILAISGAYSGIFNRTGILDNLLLFIEKCSTKTGRFAVTFIISVLSSVIFCNQTIATLICGNLLTAPYLNTGGSRQELAIDMENSVIVIVALIPWCIACSVPLTFFGVGVQALPWAVYPYMIPLCYFFTKKFWFENKVHA